MVFLLVAAFSARGTQSAQGEPNAELQKRGQEMIRRLVEVNRYWLMAPSAKVTNFSYVLNRVSGTQLFEVTRPSNTPRAKLQGVTYSAMLHQLAKAPRSAVVREITEERGRVRLVLGFNPGIRGACGNGVAGSWNGYHSLGGTEGFVVLDPERWVPLESQIGRLHEEFGEFVQLDEGHYAPLKIRIEVGESSYDWRFRVYEPGLWLFDDSFSGSRRIAWTETVQVNSEQPRVEHATRSSVALERSRKIGESRLQEFLQANRHWLIPSLEARRGLAYEYQQETPYRERVWFDLDGNILAQLESAKEKPDHPSRQSLWLADGRSWQGDVNDRFVQLQSADQNRSAGAPASLPAKNWIERDRLPQHLAIGLALDCALTRLARDPAAFWAEVQPVSKQPDLYVLVLHSKHDARLFTGTMLAFTSWCFMHDVDYSRSEILCDKATHRPLEERDYAGTSELKGHFVFEDWIEHSSGAAPGRIRAVIPHHKEGKDQSLDMSARFRFTRPGVWLLNEAESSFRGMGGSTGVLSGVTFQTTPPLQVSELLNKAKATEATLASIAQTPEGHASLAFPGKEWRAFPLRATWTDQARDSARDREKEQQQSPLVGIHRVRAVEAPGGVVHLEFEGVSTAFWKEFRTQWKVSFEGNEGGVASASTNLTVRAERGPTAFLMSIVVPPTASVLTRSRLTVSASVERMTGAYHGHGRWMHFVDNDQL